MLEPGTESCWRADNVGGVTQPPLAERLAAVQQRVADAAHDAGRNPADITTIVVTKFQPLQLLRDLHALGVRHFGESRHPEAREKAAALPEATWHFVGQLQANKARPVARYADVIHSVDRIPLIEALAGGHLAGQALAGEALADQALARRALAGHPLAGHPLDVLLQLDLAGGARGRGGAAPADAEALAARILATDGLRLRGVMAVAPRDVDPASAFAELARTAERLRALAPGATWISAGMSGDFPVAIAAGATHLRIGTAITGERPPAE